MYMSVEERRKEDERLFEEEYTSLRGEAEKKYEHIPRFYCKVGHMTLVSTGSGLPLYCSVHYVSATSRRPSSSAETEGRCQVRSHRCCECNIYFYSAELCFCRGGAQN